MLNCHMLCALKSVYIVARQSYYLCTYNSFCILCSVAQTRAAANKEKEEAHEMSKPLARYVDDEDLEKMLKEREREGDPMLKFTKKTRTSVKKKSHKG